jgi:hypothetical protein
MGIRINKWTDKEGETHISLKTLVYQKGIAYISALITRSGKQEAGHEEETG